MLKKVFVKKSVRVLLKNFLKNFEIVKNKYGEMPEWLNGAVSKTVYYVVVRGFESHSLRQRGVYYD